MNFLRTFLVLFIATQFTACQHDPNEAVHINTNITSLGSVGQDEVGVQEGRVVVLTQSELDDKLRELVWMNTQLVFELKNLIPNLEFCLKDKDTELDLADFPELSYTPLTDFESDQQSLGKLGINSEGKYRLISREGYYDKLKAQQKFNKEFYRLRSHVEEQLTRCSSY